MSFIRKKKIGNNWYDYEQESYRDKSGKVCTRHIRYVGASGSGSSLGTTLDSKATEKGAERLNKLESNTKSQNLNEVDEKKFKKWEAKFNKAQGKEIGTTNKDKVINVENNIKSIRNAERLKTKYENAGYNLKDERMTGLNKHRFVYTKSKISGQISNIDSKNVYSYRKTSEKIFKKYPSFMDRKKEKYEIIRNGKIVSKTSNVSKAKAKIGYLKKMEDTFVKGKKIGTTNKDYPTTKEKKEKLYVSERFGFYSVRNKKDDKIVYNATNVYDANAVFKKRMGRNIEQKDYTNYKPNPRGIGTTKKPTNLEYKEAYFSKGKKWKDMSKEEKAEYANNVSGRHY